MASDPKTQSALPSRSSTGGESDPQRHKHRSPNYPYVGLSRAVDLVRAMYETDRRSKIPAPIAHKRWGFKENSSSGIQTLAALDSYGLIDVEGKGDDKRISVSESVIKYLFATKPEDKKSLAEAWALAPSINAKVWQHFEGRLEPDNILKEYLVVHLNFNSDSVKSFISRFKDSIEFAGMANGAYTSSDEVNPPPLPADELLMNPQTNPAILNPGATTPPVLPSLPPLAANQSELNFTLRSGPVQLRFPSGIAGPEFVAMKQMLDFYFSAHGLTVPKSERSPDN